MLMSPRIAAAIASIAKTALTKRSNPPAMITTGVFWATMFSRFASSQNRLTTATPRLGSPRKRRVLGRGQQIGLITFPRFTVWKHDIGTGAAISAVTRWCLPILSPNVGKSGGLQNGFVDHRLHRSGGIHVVGWGDQPALNRIGSLHHRPRGQRPTDTVTAHETETPPAQSRLQTDAGQQ